MPAAGLVVLLGCAAAHLALALMSPSPWWVPDLTLVGLILSVGRFPSRWLGLSGAAGLLTMAWAIRSFGPMFAGYLLIGWATRVVGHRWDATDLRIESWLAGAGSLLLTLGAFWLDDQWSATLLLLMAVRTALTCATVGLVHHLAAQVGRPRQVTG